MDNVCSCGHLLTYKKSIPSEIIEVGDLVMLDIGTSYIRKAFVNNLEDLMINSRLVVGVCVRSDNSSPLPGIIDAGSSQIINRELVDAGVSDSIQTLIIESGNADQNSREIIQIAYNGEHIINICGYVGLGDKLCLSEHPGKAKSQDFLDNTYFKSRSIGKVIQFTNKRDQVKALLDIE